MSETFWFNDPTVLLNKQYMMNIWPKKGESFDQKLNAITRLVILLTVLGYLFTFSMKLIISGVITLVVLVVLYKTQKKKHTEQKMKTALKEGFTNPDLYAMTKSNFTQPTTQNPLMNVQLPEIKYNPHRKAAAPAFNPAVETEINDSVKNGLDSRLFQDLGDNIEFEGSMRNFYSTANTRIPNDQKAFAEFCYGDMRSCKEGDGIQCEKKNYRFTTP